MKRIPDGIYEFYGSYRWLSNFWYVDIYYFNMTFPSVEHAYQAAKAHLVSDIKMMRAIQRAASPGEAKRLGRQVKISVEMWDSMKLSVMRELVAKKFNNPELRKKLLATGNRLLVEGNNWGDTFWGYDKKRCYGKNWLGKILMELRGKLAKERVDGLA